jgi:ketosteroid isomerase-like protein
MTMKYIRVVVVVGMLVALSQVWAQTPSAVEQDLLKLESNWGDALLKNDTAALERIYADEYLFTDSEGVTWNKSQDLANTKSGASKITSFKLEDMKVHVYGEAAVVTGKTILKGTFQGKDISGQHRFTDVFVKRAGRWQCVATQSTLISKK